MWKWLRLQPAFTVDVPIDADELLRRVKRLFAEPRFRGIAKTASMCIDYTIELADQRFWSPHLSIQVSQTESGSQLHCRFSPRPEIWTMFMAIYFVVLMLMFAASIYAYVQWWMGDAMWSLLMMPMGVVLIATLHAASQIGQGLSGDQMELLRGRLDQTLTAIGAASVTARSTDRGALDDKAVDDKAIENHVAASERLQ